MQNVIQYLQNRAEVIFRVMLSLIFIIAGGNHLFATSAVSARLADTGLGALLISVISAELLVILAGIALVVGGLGLLLGFKTRWAALGLLLVLIPITITVQLQGLQTLGPLFKNIALMGALIHFVANGSTCYAIDNITSRKLHTQT